MSALTLQDQVIDAVARRVDDWRGFPLAAAHEAYPEKAPHYEPAKDSERPVSDTTKRLLQHWFRQEPHIIGVEPHTTAFKYWPHQRRLVETFIYLYEVIGIRRTEDLFRFAGVESMGPQRDPWAKLGGQLATGSGKTKMMSLIIAWAQLNAVCEHSNPLGLGRHALVIAPGLFVRDRLLQDFAPADRGVSVFWSDPVIPPELEPFWNLQVYDPTTCPRELDPDDGILVVTNYHQLLRSRGAMTEESPDNPEDRQIRILFDDPEPEKLESVSSPLIERFAHSKGILVLNDEAHHVWDEPGHATFEERARQRAESKEDELEAMAWIRSIRQLNGGDAGANRVGLQVDLSATLFQETGTTTQTKKGKKAGRTEVRFKDTELFRHTVVTYDLAEAIRDGIVKKPILERVEVRNERTGEPLPLVQEAAPNAWKKYEHLLVTGIQRWKKVRDQLRQEGDGRKPILFVLCANKIEATEVANYLTYSNPVSDDLSGTAVRGYLDSKGGEPLFIERDEAGVARSTVVQIHIGQKEESNEADWEKVRAAVNAIDRDEIEVRDATGALVALPNPYNVVVSVMMLKEGWDVRNVKVVVPLRPCGSRTLTEQTLGRGLRRMHPPVIDDDGAASMTPEELYVIEHPSFQEILEQINDLIERKSGDEIDNKPTYVAVPPIENVEEREAADVRLARIEELRTGAREWRREMDVSSLPPLAPRLPWFAEIDATVIQTWLKKALEVGEEEGQRFTLPAQPSYRDFDHVIEIAYAIPLLRELRVGYQHKTAVKDVVKQFLERKTFSLPAGIPIRFDEVDVAEDAAIALGNLARPEIVAAVRGALLTPIHDAIQASLRAPTTEVSVRHAAQLVGYQALKQNVLEQLKKSPFQRLAGTNPEERRLAVLLEAAGDVHGWVFNHRQGVGYSIPYDWQGYTARYFPDFVVRAKFGDTYHNCIVEVKGRLDDKDKAKARRGWRWCELLTQCDSEPWHYVMLIENAALDRSDITWWERQSVRRIEDLLRRHEGLPLIPLPSGTQAAVEILPTLGTEEQYRSAVPVYDLSEVVTDWGTPQKPEVLGWARLAQRPLEPEMFVARIDGHSMEPGIPAGAWGLFRSFPDTAAPSLTSLDTRRVLVKLVALVDPETGHYSLSRWHVSKRDEKGQIIEIALKPDNRTLAPIHMKPGTNGRAIAEYLETVG